MHSMETVGFRELSATDLEQVEGGLSITDVLNFGRDLFNWGLKVVQSVRPLIDEVRGLFAGLRA